MAYFLRVIMALTYLALLFIIASAMNWLPLSFNHIKIAVPFFIFMIFEQAFVMFFFIGVYRLTVNVYQSLETRNFEELGIAPVDEANLASLTDKAKTYLQSSNLSKRKIIPWTMLTLTLGTFAFLLGGAHDTGLVAKHVHSGVVLGFVIAASLSSFFQWRYLGKIHLLLRKLKSTFDLPDHQM
jgi:hypothetical protein